jgi:hypothetical protein
VSTSGTDNPDCLQGSPCATIAHAVSRASSGDTIFIGVRRPQDFSFGHNFRKVKAFLDHIKH